MNTILFLTACVNPNGMVFTKLNNPEVRLKQYKDALDWYLQNTDLSIILVENSGCDFSADYKEFVDRGRLEFISYNGNDYDRTLGKGYGEAQIMYYGINNSSIISARESRIVKVTGRFICRNIKSICEEHNKLNVVYANISKDDWGGDISTSSCVIAPKSFWTEYFLPYRETLNDSKRHHFEHLLYEAIERWRGDGKKHKEFWTIPQMEGTSGTSGIYYSSSPVRDMKSKLLYFLHKLGYRGYLNPFYKGNKDYVINER